MPTARPRWSVPYRVLLDEKADPPMWGRPNDVMVMRDGSMLVSDDQNGIIYRVSYAKK